MAPEFRTDEARLLERLEADFSSGNESRIESGEDWLNIVVRNFPGQAPDIYRNLASSTIETSRLAIARKIGLLASLSPEAAATIWVGLLEEGKTEVARRAYESFSDYCYEVERGYKPGEHLTPMSRILQAKDQN